MNWLVDALLVLADIFSGGATTPESVEWGISLQGAQDLLTIAAVEHLGEQTTPQGQQQPPQQPASSGSGRPIYCNPNVIAAIKAAWSKQNPGNVLKPNSTEAGFPACRTPSGGYNAGNGPANAPPEIQVGSTKGFDITYRTNAAAIFHTHPNGEGLPSTPGNNAGESPSGDTGAAIDAGKDIYVISYGGLSVASATGPRDPKYNKNNKPWIIQGNGIDDWLKKLNNKCNAM